MSSIGRFSDLMYCNTLDAWRDKVFTLGQEFGYDRMLLAIFPNSNTPIEVEFAFLHHSYPAKWLSKYDHEKMGAIDPIIAHCASKTTPLIWTSEVFSEPGQKEFYEEASSYGLRSGVTLPIHGVSSELGILSFVSDVAPGKKFLRKVTSSLPELSYLRDFIFESSVKFMKAVPLQARAVHMTNRELECLKWGAEGKSSWEIGKILHCTESTVNFHFSNIRRKLNSNSRQQSVVKAIRLGLIFSS